MEHPIELPSNFNYIAVFLTFSCQLRCTYCINHHGGDLVKGRRMEPKDWIYGLNRIKARDIPITIQGGEPTVYKGFYEVINGIRRETSLDLLTNLEVDIERFKENISPERFNRKAPYASIRVSYHHGQSDFLKLTERVLKLKKAGYSIGVFEVNHPDYKEDVLKRQGLATAMGIDWRVKEFLGPWKGENYGTFRYQDAVNSKSIRHCMCKTSELLIDPSGNIFRCHSDLYANRSAICHLFDKDVTTALGMWRFCNVMGKCNSCDIKVKNNRFQEWGYSSVEIKDIQTPYNDNKDYVKEVKNTYGQK
jgi:sulfatase maturation enzyme AslB (radical SAM superfamily)